MDSAFLPFDRAAATGKGQVVACLQLPTTLIVAIETGRHLPDISVLVLAGRS
jgi:hypothetical protein